VGRIVFQELFQFAETESWVIGQERMKRELEKAVQGAASGIDGGYSGRGKHYMLFLRIRADIFQEGRFARTCLARQEYGLTGILNEVQGILKLFVLCIGNEAQKISDL
jgi:hypothetical protein